jgi:hypothetical protein
MRATEARESVRAAAERRKCWGISRISAINLADTVGHQALAVNTNLAYMSGRTLFCEVAMDFESKEREWAGRTKRFLKAELKRADVTYEELARRLREHGLEETESSITNKLSRGTFPATFFIAAMRAVGRENVNLADI